MGAAKILPPDPDAILLPYQGKWVADRSPLKLCEKSRQTGMSWVSAYEQVERRAAAGARDDAWISSRDDALSRQFIVDCKHWIESLSLAAEDVGEIILDYDDDRQPITARQIKFATGRSIYSLSSNPDAQAGRRGDRLLDEFALHPDPRKLFGIAQPGITWGGGIAIVSTHRGTGNYFNELITEIREKGNPKNFSCHRITLEDALIQGLLYKLQQRLPPQHPVQEMDEPEYFDYIRSQAPDEETFQQEYMCRPTDDEAAFLSYELIASCQYAPGENWQAISDRPRLFAGVDIGRTRDLTVLWVVEALGDVLYTRHLECLSNMRKSEQEALLWPWFARCERVCIDKTGIGLGWVDDAQDRFGEHRIEGVTFTSQVKETLAFPFKGRLEDRTIRFPDDDHLRADLRMVKKTTTVAGNVRFDAERTPDGHADRFWAGALAIHAASMPHMEYGYMPVGREPRHTGRLPMHERDYDVDYPAPGGSAGPVGGSLRGNSRRGVY